MNRMKHILLVDDNNNDIQLALMALEREDWGPRIDVAHDGAEALDYLYRREEFQARSEPNPDVILLDIKMPRVDGLEVLRQIKQDEALKLIPVVMLSSSREERDIVTSYHLGANAYVVKPVIFTEFVETIQATVAFWMERNELPARRGAGMFATVI